MLFDEATSALDPELVGEVPDTMRLLAEEGMTMICVTHEMGFARDVSDRIAFFHEGMMEEIGPPEQIFGAPHSKNTRSFSPRCADARARSDNTGRPARAGADSKTGGPDAPDPERNTPCPPVSSPVACRP